MRRAAALLLIAGGLAPGSSARAHDESTDRPIAVSVAECPSAALGPEPFLSVLRVELAGEGRACCARLGDPATPPGPATASIDPCGVANQVLVHVRDDRTGAALDRQVALADVAPEARPRALALAVAELLRAAAAAPPPVSAPPPVAPPPADKTDGWSPVLGFAARTLPTGEMTLLGFHADLQLARGRWQAALGGHVESASPAVSLGKVDTTFAGGSLELGVRLRPGTSIVDLGAVAGLGIVHLDGIPGDPRAVAGSGSGLEAHAGARGSFDFWRIPHDRARARLVLEGGAVVRSVEATVNGRDAAGLTGAYLLGGIAAALGPF